MYPAREQRKISFSTLAASSSTIKRLQFCEYRTVAFQSRIAVIRIDFVDGKPPFIAKIREYHFLCFNTNALKTPPNNPRLISLTYNYRGNQENRKSAGIFGAYL